MNNIIQWNIQSYKSNFNELKILLQKYAPACVCIQETLIRPNQIKAPSGYHAITSTVTRDDGHERGVAILIHKGVFYQQIQLQSNLQALAIKLYLNKIYTVCTIYLPHINVTKPEIENVINQLHAPFMMLGDMNARSPIWDNSTDNTNEKGLIFEQILTEHPISLLNNYSPTHYHIQTDTYTVIDLSMLSSDCLFDFEYNVSDSLHNSDHYPIIIKLKTNENFFPERPNLYNIKKANWPQFSLLTEMNVNINEIEDVDAAIDVIKDILLNAANESIPMKSTHFRKPPVPWWNNDVADARRDRRRAERTLRRNFSIENKIAYNRARAKSRYIMNKK